MAEAAPDVAALFFWSYCLIAVRSSAVFMSVHILVSAVVPCSLLPRFSLQFFLLLNVFLSIVVDAYMTVRLPHTPCAS